VKQKIIVLGGGFGGLAVAIRLAARGHEVERFEKRDKLAGRKREEAPFIACDPFYRIYGEGAPFCSRSASFFVHDNMTHFTAQGCRACSPRRKS